MPDFNLEVIKYLSSMGIGGAIAGLLFIFYRKDVRSYTDLWQLQAKAWQDQNIILLSVIRENTAAFTKNSEVVASLTRVVEEREKRRELQTHHRQT